MKSNVNIYIFLLLKLAWPLQQQIGRHTNTVPRKRPEAFLKVCF